MSIKLNAQSGGSVALDAPTQTTGSADNLYKLPIADGSAGQVLTTDGSGNLSWATDSGKILQVVQTVKKDRFTTTSSSYTDITGMTVTITPTKASSKILITATGVSGSTADESYNHARLNRSIAGGSFDDTIIIGDASGSETRASLDMSLNDVNPSHPAANTRTFSFEYLDSPSYSVGNAIIYKFQVKTTNSGGGTLVIGGSSGTGDYNGRSVPTFLTVKEVAA